MILEIIMNRDLLELQIYAWAMFALWRGVSLYDDFDVTEMLPQIIKEIILILCFSVFLSLFNVFYNNTEKQRMVLCQPYIGQTIIKKQLPNLLVFKDDKFLRTWYDKQWYENKKVGDTLKKEECKYIEWETLPY